MAFNVAAAPVGILARALTGNVFVEQKLAYMNEGDKDSYNVLKQDLKNTLSAYSADPSVGGSDSSETEDFLRPLTIVQSFEQFNPADYHQYWREYQPKGNFQWEGLPTQVQNNLEELFLGSSVEAVEDELTNGTGGFVTGLVDQLRSSALTSLDGASPTSAQITANSRIAYGDYGADVITTSNVFTELELLIQNQTLSQRKRPGRKFMVNHTTADIIMEAQRLELNFKGVDIFDEGKMRYAGYEIIINPSFPNDAIMLCSMTGSFQTDAIQLGTSQSSDFNNVEVQRLSNFGRVWGMALTLALDIFVVRPEEVCFRTALAQLT
jgi:hypothetical protein